MAVHKNIYFILSLLLPLITLNCQLQLQPLFCLQMIWIGDEWLNDLIAREFSSVKNIFIHFQSSMNVIEITKLWPELFQMYNFIYPILKSIWILLNVRKDKNEIVFWVIKKEFSNSRTTVLFMTKINMNLQWTFHLVITK